MGTCDEKWKTTRKGRSYHVTPSKTINPPITTTNREPGAVTTGLMTGHGFNRSYLHRIPTTKISSPKCPCKYTSDQTPEQLVLYCQNYNLPALQGKLKRAITPMNLAWGTGMHTKKGLTPAIEHLIGPSGIGTRGWVTTSRQGDKQEEGEEGREGAGRGTLG